MTLSVTHTKVAVIPDDGTSEVGSDEWNAAHAISGVVPAANLPPAREVLIADRTYFVRTDGSDSNTGLVDNAGGAFLTITKALAGVTTIDGNGFRVTIQIGAGTFTANHDASTPLVGIGTLHLIGADSSGGTVMTSPDVTLTVAGNRVLVQNIEFRSARDAIFAFAGGVVSLGTGVRFGAVGGVHFSLYPGGIIFADTPYDIVGNFRNHVYSAGGFFENYAECTLTGTLSFDIFIDMHGGAYYEGTGPFTVVGSVAGTRFNLTGGASVISYGSGPNFFPGNVAGLGGTTTGGGFYDT